MEETTKNLLIEMVSSFETDEIREFAKLCIKNAPKYWFHVPASSTGKYHPKFSLGDGGLLRHEVAVLRLLNHMLMVESIASDFTSRERDLLPAPQPVNVPLTLLWNLLLSVLIAGTLWLLIRLWR